MSDDHSFCAACGEPLKGGLDSPGLTVDTQPRGLTPMVVGGLQGPRLSLLADDGDVVREIPLERGEIVVGRGHGDVQFDDDDAVSPEHAVLTWKDNALHVRDLGSSNGSWLYILAPQALTDGDVLLFGSQVIRFRKLSSGFLLDDAELRQAGSRTPARDDAMLEQLRADGSVRTRSVRLPAQAAVRSAATARRALILTAYQPAASSSVRRYHGASGRVIGRTAGSVTPACRYA